MKKKYLLTLLLIASLTVRAQINVNANGDVAIKGPFKPNTALTIYTDEKALNCVLVNGGQTWDTALESFSEASGNSFGVAINGTSYKMSNNGSVGRAYGVIGRAGYATSGYNYGVYGQLVEDQYNGAAVLGSLNASNIGLYLNNRYAGYFQGLTHVAGNLTVSGTISGMVVARSTESVSSDDGTESLAEASLSEQLQGLTASSYFMPDENASQNRAGRTSDADTIDVSIPLTSVEKQVLTKQHYALSAEQLAKSFPDLVYEMENGEQCINYVELIPILVQAINELNAKIKILEGSQLMKSKQTAAIENAEHDSSIFLGQNYPSPVTNETFVDITIPENIHKASLFIYDTKGTKIKQEDIARRGTTTMRIDTSNLSTGIYVYSLVANGKVAQTRRMIVE